MNARTIAKALALSALFATGASSVVHAQPGQLTQVTGSGWKVEVQADTGLITFQVQSAYYDDDVGYTLLTLCPNAVTQDGRMVGYIADNAANRTLIERFLHSPIGRFTFREGRDGRCWLVRLGSDYI